MGRKKNGEMPTGILAHAAKASGHSSVHDLLIKGSDMVAAAQTLTSLPLKVKKVKALLGNSLFSMQLRILLDLLC